MSVEVILKLRISPDMPGYVRKYPNITVGSKFPDVLIMSIAAACTAIHVPWQISLLSVLKNHGPAKRIVDVQSRAHSKQKWGNSVAVNLVLVGTIVPLPLTWKHHPAAILVSYYEQNCRDAISFRYWGTVSSSGLRVILRPWPMTNGSDNWKWNPPNLCCVLSTELP